MLQRYILYKCYVKSHSNQHLIIALSQTIEYKYFLNKYRYNFVLMFSLPAGEWGTLDESRGSSDR